MNNLARYIHKCLWLSMQHQTFDKASVMQDVCENETSGNIIAFK